MADYLFVPQSVLDRWSEQGKVMVEGHVLTLKGGHGNQVFALTAAVRFLRMEAGEDVSQLMQKVKTLDALKQLGAEHYLDSVIIGDNAYEVQQGFLADANAIRRAAQGDSVGSISSKGVKKAAGKSPSSPGKVVVSEEAPAAKAAPQAAAPAAGDAKPATKSEGGEPDLLAQFFLDNLQ